MVETEKQLRIVLLEDVRISTKIWHFAELTKVGRIEYALMWPISDEAFFPLIVGALV